MAERCCSKAAEWQTSESPSLLILLQGLHQRITCGKGGQHAQGGTGNAEHVGQGEADKDADGDDDARDDGGLVSQSQTKDDVSGSTGPAGVGHILHSTLSCSFERCRCRTFQICCQNNGCNCAVRPAPGAKALRTRALLPEWNAVLCSVV